MFEDYIRERITELRMRKKCIRKMYEFRYGTFTRIYKSYNIRKKQCHP